ncbi:MAG TPA: hypothetical protein VFU31_20130 [Candidatus Binatia bacterium]|nr:hypothetical protein [Candidatus Binatia bacterium]
MKIQARPARPAALQPVFAFASSWPQRTREWLILALLCFFVGCSSSPRTISFQHNYHRQDLSFSEEDLKQLQFFTSTDIVARYKDATGMKSLLVPALTPGVVTGAGSNWLKVSFREGGVDVPFVTDPNQYNAFYWIATEVEGSKELKKVTELPERYFLYKGIRYQLVSGSDAYLLVDWKGWEKLANTRKVTEGRRVGDR